MKIIVCAGEVPDTTEVRIDPKTNTLIREGVPSIINPDDKNAIEAALTLKIITPAPPSPWFAGPSAGRSSFAGRLAMGCDEAILVTDRAFGGSTLGPQCLVPCRRRIGYDKILRRQAIDGDTAQVGPQIAEPESASGDLRCRYQAGRDTLTVQRNLEDGYQIVEVKMPCMLTCIKELNTPRYPSMGGIYDAYKKEIVYFTNEKLNVDPTLCGLKSSPTKVNKTFTPPAKDPGILIPEANEQTVSQVYQALKEKHYL